jgi:hypothetical protein
VTSEIGSLYQRARSLRASNTCANRNVYQSLIGFEEQSPLLYSPNGQGESKHKVRNETPSLFANTFLVCMDERVKGPAQSGSLGNNRRSESYETWSRLTNGEVFQESSNVRGRVTPVKSIVPMRISWQKH